MRFKIGEYVISASRARRDSALLNLIDKAKDASAAIDRVGYRDGGYRSSEEEDR